MIYYRPRNIKRGPWGCVNNPLSLIRDIRECSIIMCRGDESRGALQNLSLDLGGGATNFVNRVRGATKFVTSETRMKK